MSQFENFDLTYITIDSLSEGVGSSQITPLITRLSKSGMKINLISFEKLPPNGHFLDYFNTLGVQWNAQPFGPNGLIGGANRLNILKKQISRTHLIHARSDIPAVAGIASHQAPVLWDVRSLWADQKIVIQKNHQNRGLYNTYRRLESIAAARSLGMSTLTNAVIPILEQRNKRLPSIRTVVPTAVDLDHFKLNSQMPTEIQALFSGTYNEYYDLKLSASFMNELRKQCLVDTHWARPAESNKPRIDVGESRVIPATQAEMADLIPNYSFGVAICKLDSGTSLTAAMPTKIGEFLACGRPVVVNKGLGDMDQFIDEFNIGVILNGEQDNLVQGVTKLLELISDPSTPSRCRASAEKYFSMDKGTNAYLKIYKEILNVGI